MVRAGSARPAGGLFRRRAAAAGRADPGSRGRGDRRSGRRRSLAAASPARSASSAKRRWRSTPPAASPRSRCARATASPAARSSLGLDPTSLSAAAASARAEADRARADYRRLSGLFAKGWVTAPRVETARASAAAGRGAAATDRLRCRPRHDSRAFGRRRPAPPRRTRADHQPGPDHPDPRRSGDRLCIATAAVGCRSWPHQPRPARRSDHPGAGQPGLCRQRFRSRRARRCRHRHLPRRTGAAGAARSAFGVDRLGGAAAGTRRQRAAAWRCRRRRCSARAPTKALSMSSIRRHRSSGCARSGSAGSTTAPSP